MLRKTTLKGRECLSHFFDTIGAVSPYLLTVKTVSLVITVRNLNGGMSRVCASYVIDAEIFGGTYIGRRVYI